MVTEPFMVDHGQQRVFDFLRCFIFSLTPETLANF